VNAKSGACSEDCGFCSQSVHFKTKAPAYALIEPSEVVKAARQALEDGAQAFSVVISGKGIKNDQELNAIGEIVKTVRREVGIDVHASVGIVTKEQIEYLKACGVTMLHHNLETSERYFPSICTTHSYRERIQTIQTARECGMRLCAGGIFGLGEDLRDRIDMAFELRKLGVSVIPMNFLCAIEGTPLAGQSPLPPMEILSIISLYRFILPDKEIKICGGRDANLRDLQSMIFLAGADSMMIGNYLTTAGREPERDWQMMRDLHLQWSARGVASEKGDSNSECER
jgi:biotin synthase